MPLSITIIGLAVHVQEARSVQVFQEVRSPLTWHEATVLTCGVEGEAFHLGVPYATGGNAEGDLVLNTGSRCGRTVVLARDSVSVVWRETGYQIDTDGDALRGSGDFFTYLGWFFAGDPQADYTGDGVVNSDDVFGWLQCFLS